MITVTELSLKSISKVISIKQMQKNMLSKKIKLMTQSVDSNVEIVSKILTDDLVSAAVSRNIRINSKISESFILIISFILFKLRHVRLKIISLLISSIEYKKQRADIDTASICSKLISLLILIRSCAFKIVYLSHKFLQKRTL